MSYWDSNFPKFTFWKIWISVNDFGTGNMGFCKRWVSLQHSLKLIVQENDIFVSIIKFLKIYMEREELKFNYAIFHILFDSPVALITMHEYYKRKIIFKDFSFFFCVCVFNNSINFISSKEAYVTIPSQL